MNESETGESPLATWAEGYDAWRQLLEATHHSLWVLDHDLTGFHPDRSDWPDAMLACVRRCGRGQFRILVRDETALLTRLPRTRQILIDYAHVVEVRKIAAQHASSIEQSLAIGDERHCLLRPRHDLARAYFRTEDAADVARHLPKVLDVWDCASPLSMGTVLGL